MGELEVHDAAGVDYGIGRQLGDHKSGSFLFLVVEGHSPDRRPGIAGRFDGGREVSLDRHLASRVSNPSSSKPASPEANTGSLP